MTKNTGFVDRCLEVSRSYFRGLGQIMLQESAVTGVLFLAGIFVNSRLMGIGALAGASASFLTALILRYPPTEVSRGWYGFNGALVGTALLCFNAPGVMTFVLVVAGGAFSTVLMHLMPAWTGRLPPYTAPFILATWLMQGIAHGVGLTAGTAATSVAYEDGVVAIALGVGQVMFQEYWVSGILFVIGIGVCSRQAAAWAVMGSALAVTTAEALGYPPDLIRAGIYGFNASLVAIALAGRCRDNVVAVLAGIVLSVVMTRGFQFTPVPALTAPFVLSTWLVIGAAEFRQARRDCR
ncbi:MAG: urea transporter [Opitutaceae bacterium]|nr:urea transporter [Opitutaceae bacterium]